MATEEVKKQNQVRLSDMTLISLAAGTWKVLGKGATAFSVPMGDELLKLMEQEMGLEIAGEDPEDVMTEITRIFVDEFGFASDIEVTVENHEKFQLRVRNCVNYSLSEKLSAAGVEKPFMCPIMNSCRSALKRLGYKCREDITSWKDGKGSIINFSAI